MGEIGNEIYFYSNEYRIERLTESSIGDLILLFQLCFNTTPEKSDLINKHLYCHGKNHFIGYIAYTNEDIPAAFYGVFPQILVHNQTEMLFAQSGDTMTHPDHQKKGLFIMLANYTFDLCKELGIQGIFGFPNKNSYHGFINKLNFVESDELVSLTFLENRFGYYRFFNSTYSERWSLSLARLIFKKGEYFENSHSKFKKTKNSYLKHDNIFFLAKKKTNLKVLNIHNTNVIIKINNNTLIVGDIDTENALIQKKIIKSLKRFCIFSGLRFLTIESSKNSHLYLNLKGICKNERPAYKSIIHFFPNTKPIDTISFLGCDVDIF